MLGNVPQLISSRCCLGVSCFPSLFFLLLTQKTLEKMDGLLTKERFILFSRRCILRNTADMLHFMLHRHLCVTTVKIVCCHIAIPHIFRDEVTCGRFQLYIWRLNVKHALSFNSPLSNKFTFNVDRRYHHSVRP